MSLNQKIANLLKFKGPAAAVLTPYDDEGEVNVSVISGYLAYLNESGVSGAFVTGTTGEGYLLTNDEKIAIATEWTKARNEQKLDFTVMINVTSTCLKESLKLARTCDKLNVDAIAILPQIYYKLQTVKDLINYVKLFAAAAPNTPILYYFIPAFSGELPFDIVEFIGVALQEIPQFAGMKFTDTNITRLSALQKHNDRFKVFAGYEETLTTAAFGDSVRASIGATYSVPGFAKYYLKILEALDNNDLSTARKAQDEINKLLAQLKSGNFIANIKNAVNNELKSRNLYFGTPRAPIYYK